MDTEKLKEQEEKLYQLNAFISGHFLTKIRKPTLGDMEALNLGIGEGIKNLREIRESAE